MPDDSSGGEEAVQHLNLQVPTTGLEVTPGTDLAWQRREARESERAPRYCVWHLRPHSSITQRFSMDLVQG